MTDYCKVKQCSLGQTLCMQMTYDMVFNTSTTVYPAWRKWCSASTLCDLEKGLCGWFNKRLKEEGSSMTIKNCNYDCAAYNAFGRGEASGSLKSRYSMVMAMIVLMSVLVS